MMTDELMTGVFYSTHTPCHIVVPYQLYELYVCGKSSRTL